MNANSTQYHPHPQPHPKITQTHETITKWNIIYLYNTRHMNLGMWFKEIHHELQTCMDLTWNRRKLHRFNNVIMSPVVI